MPATPEERRLRTAARLAELEEVELEIEKLVAGGDGFARFEGIPFFVPRSVPGDVLRVRVVDRRPDYARGEVIEIISPSGDRRTPRCEHFDACGGCDLQQIDDARQVEHKAAATLETLRRLGRLELDPAEVELVTASAWGYRLRTQVHTEAVRDPETSEVIGHQVGYFGRGSHDLVAVDACPVLTPELEREVVTLGRRLPQEAPRRIDLAVGEDGRLSVSPVVGDLRHGELEWRIGGHRYSFDSRCFFQGHRDLLARLVECAVGEARGDLAVDLYCGVGLFSLPLAEHYERVLAVESDRIALRYARKNARRAGVEVSFDGRAVESYIRELPAETDRVLVDPPRNGLAARVRLALVDRPVSHLTYVSCNAATLARDLGVLGKAYEVRSVALFDLFPQTGHMEVVAQLERP